MNSIANLPQSFSENPCFLMGKALSEIIYPHVTANLLCFGGGKVHFAQFCQNCAIGKFALKNARGGKMIFLPCLLSPIATV